MSLISQVRSMLETTTGGKPADGPTGSYWCHDCEERVPGGDVDDTEPPACPSCGEAMTFERSPGSANCAC